MIRRSWFTIGAVLALTTAAFSQTVNDIQPNSAPAGSGPLTVTINGQFPLSPPPQVDWYIPSTDQLHVLSIVGTPTTSQVMATIPASLLTTPGSAEIYLNNHTVSFAIFTVTILRRRSAPCRRILQWPAVQASRSP